MKLNLGILKEDLASWEWAGTIVDEPYTAQCDYPLLCKTCPEEFAEDILYILEAQSLPDTPPETAGFAPSILCLGRPDTAWLMGNRNILYTPRHSEGAELLNEVIRCFHTYRRWEESMQDILDRGLPLSALGSVSLPIVGNGILVHGPAYNIVFAMVSDISAPTRTYQYFKEAYDGLENTMMTLEDINLLISDPEYNRAIEAEHPTIYSGARFGVRTLYYNIRRDGTVAARLCFDEVVRPFTDKDYVLIQVLARYLEKGLSAQVGYSLNRPVGLDEILTKLLNHQLVSEKQLLSLLLTLHWDFDDRYVCMTLKMKTGDDTTSALSPLAAGLAVLLHNECYAIFHGEIVFICNLTKSELTRDQLLESSLPMLRDNLLSAGISTVYHDFRQLYYYYLQTEAARRLGEKKDPTYWYFRYEDYHMANILDKCMKGTVLETMIPAGLKALIEYDQRKGSDYVGLLRVYLDQERNIAETIRKTYMHRNTFAYRIKKIEKILNMDLDDARVRFVLQLAFLLMDREPSAISSFRP